jgi:hypothetical protein
MRVARLGALSILGAALIAAGAGVANAAPAPRHNLQTAAKPVPVRPADPLADYNNAIAAQGAQESANALASGLAGAAIGALPGCLFGGVIGLPILPAELATIPFGCAMGALFGGGVGAVIGTSTAFSATEPGVMQACYRAMPVWACQLKEQLRENPPQ